MTGASDPWLRFAERADALRVIPRILVIFYYTFFAWFAWYLSTWFMSYDFNSLENEAVALAIAGFPAAVLGVMTTVLGSLTNNYFRTGKSAGVGE
jgi:hypothetical protein